MTDRARTTGSATTTIASAAGNRRRRPWAVFVRRLVREKPLGLLGAVIIVLFVLVSVFADLLAPDPEQLQDVTRSLQAPSARHLLGTDHTGRDFLSRNIYGARLSLLVGFAATAGGGSGSHRDRRSVGVRRRPARPAAATVRRCLDGLSGTSPAHDGDVDSGYRYAADHHRAGPDLRRRQLARGPGRRDRRQRRTPTSRPRWRSGALFGAPCCATCCRT